MKALIIAAGRGERLRPFTEREPKPLLSVLGLRLIERVILSARDAGIRDFVVVVGYLGEKLKRFLGSGSRYGVKIDYVRNNDWKMGNGVSVYKAKNFFRDRFILLMSDHLFDPKILSDLKRCKLDMDECILCVDRCMKYVFDVKDATKVRVIYDKVVEIGKDLNEYDGVDMGIFLCSPYIFEVLKESIKKGCYSLTDGIMELARQEKMKAHCIYDEDRYWIDVDTLESLKIAEKILLMHDQYYTFDAQKIRV